MGGGRLIMAAGDVIAVQLADADLPAEAAKKPAKPKKPRRGAAAARPVVRRMRVFLRDADGKEQKFDFEGADLGVRENQRIAVARGMRPGGREPFNLVLCNLSTGETEPFEAGLSLFLSRKPLFGPFWQGLALTAGLWLIVLVLSETVIAKGATLASAAGYGAFVAVLAFPLLWGAAVLWRRMTALGRYKRARAQLIAEVESRAQAYAPSRR